MVLLFVVALVVFMLFAPGVAGGIQVSLDTPGGHDKGADFMMMLVVFGVCLALFALLGGA